MKHFLCLLLLLFQTALIGQDRTLESISYRSQAGNTIALIKLSDQSLWKWTPDAFSENLLRKWAPGDPIVIKTINHPGFVLENLACPHYTPIVSLTFNSYLLFPQLNGFDPMTSQIKLSDGSTWELAFHFHQRTLYHWSEGDRIILAHGEHGCCELLNLDIPYPNKSQIERSVQVESCPISCSPPEKREEIPEEAPKILEPKEAEQL